MGCTKSKQEEVLHITHSALIALLDALIAEPDRKDDIINSALPIRKLKILPQDTDKRAPHQEKSQ